MESTSTITTQTIIKVCASNERMFLAMAIAVSLATLIGVFVGTVVCKRLRCRR